MLMKPDKKKNAVAVILKAGGLPQPAAEVEGAEEIEPKVVAADEVLKAIEMKDARALAEAMEALISMCSEEEYAEEGE